MGDCTGCPYAPTYEEYCNGWSDCPDAYTDKARLCNRNMINEEEIQSAIEWIEGLRDRWNDKDNVKYCNMAIKALEQTRWIPVSERLPEEYKRVIVSDVVGIYIGEFIDAEENWGGKHFINEHGMRSKSAKAWMSLPEPYKAESEEV